MTYELIEADDGSNPTIINTETRESILSIDTRTINGKTYSTPVFANRQIAETVIAALSNG